MSQASATGTVPMSSAQKGLAVLEAMAGYSTSVGVSDLARAIGWSRGTVHKWLVTLVSAGWVEQDGDGLYRISLRAVRVANGALRQASVDRRIFPFIEELAHRCRETVSLAVLDEDSAVIIQRVESPQVLSVNLRLGSRMPLAVSASGMVLAAFCANETMERLRADGVVLPTQQKIDETREAGFARSVDDLQVGISAIAVPIVYGAGSFCGALSIAKPTRSGPPERMLEMLREAQTTIHQFIEGNA